MATTKRQKPASKKPSTAARKRAAASAPKNASASASASKAPLDVLTEAEIARLDDGDGYGPDDPVAEAIAATVATAKKRATKVRALAAPGATQPVARAPLPPGMERVELFGHGYRTFGAVNTYTVGVAQIVRRQMMESLYAMLWPGEAFDPERFAAWSDANPAESGLWLQVMFIDTLFRPEGTAPPLSQALGAAALDAPEHAIVEEHAGFFVASERAS
jgi:hypothetical protein